MVVAASDPNAPVLAVPPRRRAAKSFLGIVRAGPGRWLEAFGDEAYTEFFLEQKLLWRRNLLVNDPEAIKRILLDNADNYAKTAIARRLLEPGLGKGLITMDGEVWRRHRRVLAPAFDHQSIVAAAPVMTAVAADVLARWDRLQPDAVLDLSQEMMRAALRITARTMFSIESAAIEDSVADTVRLYQEKLRPGMLDLLGLPDWLPRFPRVWIARRRLRGFHATMDRLIAARRDARAAAPHDLLSRLLAADGLSDTEIHDDVVTILMAGHETTSLALGWVWYLLALHPDAEEKLHAELDAVLAGRLPAYQDLPRLRYTRMVVEEALRLYPPAHTLSRTALGADEFGARRIAKGSVVLIVPWVLHRHRRLWERPDRFEPERFDPSRADERPRFAYIPFGAGPRVCIGAAFALTEAVLVLASLAQHYRLRLVPGHPVEPQGLITLRAAHGLMMTIARRA